MVTAIARCEQRIGRMRRLASSRVRDAADRATLARVRAEITRNFASRDNGKWPPTSRLYDEILRAGGRGGSLLMRTGALYRRATQPDVVRLPSRLDVAIGTSSTRYDVAARVTEHGRYEATIVPTRRQRAFLFSVHSRIRVGNTMTLALASALARVWRNVRWPRRRFFYLTPAAAQRVIRARASAFARGIGGH